MFGVGQIEGCQPKRRRRVGKMRRKDPARAKRRRTRGDAKAPSRGEARSPMVEGVKIWNGRRPRAQTQVISLAANPCRSGCPPLPFETLLCSSKSKRRMATAVRNPLPGAIRLPISIGSKSRKMFKNWLTLSIAALREYQQPRLSTIRIDMMNLYYESACFYSKSAEYAGIITLVCARRLGRPRWRKNQLIPMIAR